VLYALADPTLTPNLSHPGWDGAQVLVWRTAEAAETFLEDNAITMLLLRGDMEDEAHILSLVNYLIEEAPWGSRAQIEAIAVIGETETAARPLMQQLVQNTPYRVIWKQFDPAMFEQPVLYSPDEPRTTWATALPALPIVARTVLSKVFIELRLLLRPRLPGDNSSC
jgi:hypothetical protein